MRIAGIEPEITISQVSVKSVFDPIIKNRHAIDKNRQYLPLFSTAGHYNNDSGVVSVIHRDLVRLNRREVEIAGNLSAGMKTEILDLTLKAGSWKTVEENSNNGWIAGADFSLRPDLTSLITFSVLGAMNYGRVRTLNKTDDKEIIDPSANPKALIRNPLALGLGYEYRISLPGRMVLKPYLGMDFKAETGDFNIKVDDDPYDRYKITGKSSGEFDFEIGGGLQWFFRGTGTQFKRNTNIGGIALGDVKIPAAFIAGINASKDGIINAVISFNEDPRFSPIPRFGGFMDIEFMNITGKAYSAPHYGISGFISRTYNDFLWAAMAQLEYLAMDWFMPYVFFHYIPAIMPADRRSTSLEYGKEHLTLTSKLGCRFLPFKYFNIDIWYQRTDYSSQNEWTLDKGLVSISFGVGLSR
jgi:hypothetical protein